MKFFATEVEVKDRHTEQENRMAPKCEYVTLTVTLIGSGDTRKFTSGELLSIVMDKLSEIKPK